MRHTPTLLSVLLLGPLAALHSADQPAPSARPDIVLADIEQGYGTFPTTTCDVKATPLITASGSTGYY